MAVPLSDLPTLALTYASGALAPRKDEDPLFAPDADLNERVSLYRGDMTRLEVDAIVNAANRSLLGGGGVDGAIHRAAGRGLYEECKTLDGCDTGGAKITKGYDLPAKHVIHAVGPIYDEDEDEKCARLLKSCYETSLALAHEHKLSTIAFSGISTGVYGYPLDDATHIALRTTRDFLISERGASIARVIFTVFRQIDVDSYKKILPLYFPPVPLVEKEATPAPQGEKEATPVPQDEKEVTPAPIDALPPKETKESTPVPEPQPTAGQSVPEQKS
ncbi:A1pp-domain-containing protein [Auricularia subglabra TFB-10046 SS5]|uniref:A1pp-domain-containing protein n=1 Tax=Auricularia subglabra (strain TFB-10046 / SS5) TaxID=717982 RepID=J0D8J5_AURST|nr:A1pp-domain-containing protein [Auricularia subglabra TFB-10046 SS5]